MLAKFLRITNKDLSTIWEKVCFHPPFVVAYGCSLMFCCGLYAVKQFRGARSRLDPQHENQLFFVSVIIQAKTVNSDPNTKLNSQPQNSTLKNTRHNFQRLSY